MGVDVTLVIYWYSAEYYEKIFKKVGFEGFKWVYMKMSGDEANQEYWDDFLKQCKLIMFEAFKPL